jgi:hypothetical protein
MIVGDEHNLSIIYGSRLFVYKHADDRVLSCLLTRCEAAPVRGPPGGFHIPISKAVKAA